ncbi:MAG: hypothetical protein F4Y16_03250 [Holophagales bacterium]|nr:hypothetical protein [Holophagales bacterium]MYH26017.1 hypothetical protein [Holophagales bacterium]
MRLIPPTTHYLEGVMDLCYARGIHYCPHPEAGGPRCRTGYYIGRAILQIYAIEMYLRHALEDANVRSKRVKHDLHKLFRMLPNDKKEAARARYAEIMKPHLEGALSSWYVETGTIEDFLQFLGRSPITDMRYIWDPPWRHRRHDQEDNMDLKRETELGALLSAVRSLCPPDHAHHHSRR